MVKGYPIRVMTFRRSVYASRRSLTSGCQLLMLRLSESMDGACKVSVPHYRLAADLDAPESRISEWVKEAIEKGVIYRITRGRPGVTSEYQGMVFNPSDLRQRVSATYGSSEVDIPRPSVSRPPPGPSSDLRQAPPPVIGKTRPQRRTA